MKSKLPLFFFSNSSFNVSLTRPFFFSLSLSIVSLTKPFLSRANKELSELKATRTDIWEVEDRLSSKKHRRRATANDLGGPAQPI